MTRPVLLLTLLAACGGDTGPDETPSSAAAPAAEAPATTARGPDMPKPAVPPAPEPAVRTVDPAKWTTEPPPELAEEGKSSAYLLGAGLRHSRSGDLPAAATLFAASIERGGDTAMAHYALAAALAEIRTQGGAHTCTHDATLARVLDELDRAVTLSEKLRAGLREDPSFKSLHGVLRFRLLAGARLDSTAHVERTLGGTTWYAPPQGVYGNPAKVTLEAGGTASVATMNRDDPGGAWATSTGTWMVDDQGLTLSHGGTDEVLAIVPTGRLTHPDASVAWLDAPSECSA